MTLVSRLRAARCWCLELRIRRMDDMRESPSVELMKNLQDKGADVLTAIRFSLHFR